MTLIMESEERIEEGAKLYWTMKAMRQFGGGFVKALAEAMAQADPVNIQKIRATWPEYMKQYEDMGAKLREQKEKQQ